MTNSAVHSPSLVQRISIWKQIQALKSTMESLHLSQFGHFCMYTHESHYSNKILGGNTGSWLFVGICRRNKTVCEI